MATRTIPNTKDRLATMLVAPLMSCSARLPVYALLIAACIPAHAVFGIPKLLQGATMLGMYLLGIVVALLMAWLFKIMKRLQSDGTANLARAVGLEGSVYLTIPANDVGKVQIAVNGRLSVLDARATDGRTLPTGARVKVVRLANGNVLEVESA